ncbi:nucleotide-binding universal stress UspA family protein [Actinoplanes campanulatus]|uniref:Nucleotide-binding universal stress UspA family protein n=1 Tax=Actinoplanes campanulatus TaxID=113559 RepID=A0A7W5ASG5_9ACTN|nr:universal stress protein [Actinoplanes campanulatus]MBB3101480.1 nucleotide-binding universal stress UspA family protein [Actinoplanes campanulatus]
MSVRKTILAGTDGSESALTAVRWAALEAQRRTTTLTVLHAYENWPNPPDDVRDQAEAVAAEAEEAVLRLTPAVTVHRVVVLGDPAAELVRESATADLTVVGNRGRGGFSSLMLGSVSQRVAGRAACSVVVVRGRTLAFTDPVAVGSTTRRPAGPRSRRRSGSPTSGVPRSWPCTPTGRGSPTGRATRPTCSTGCYGRGGRNSPRSRSAPWSTPARRPACWSVSHTRPS